MPASGGSGRVVSAAVVLVALALAGSALGGNSKPSISGVTASAGATGGTVVVTITGIDFAHVTAVKLGNRALHFTVVSPTEIKAKVASNLVKKFAAAATFTVRERLQYAFRQITWTWTSGGRTGTNDWLIG